MGVKVELCGALCLLLADDSRLECMICGRCHEHDMALPIKLVEQRGSLVDRSAHYAYTKSGVCGGKKGKSYVSTIHDSARCTSSTWVPVPLQYFPLPPLLTRPLQSSRTPHGCHKVRSSLGWLSAQACRIRTRLFRTWNGSGRRPGRRDGPCGWQNLSSDMIKIRTHDWIEWLTDEESGSVDRELCAVGRDVSFRIDEHELGPLLALNSVRCMIKGENRCVP